MKKKHFIGLSTFLLVLLLGLFSSSYAKTLTENDIRNFCENAYKSKINNTIPTEVKQYIANADFSTWSSYTSQYEGQWVISYNDRDIIFMCFNGNDTNLNTYCMYKASNRIQVNTSFLTYIIRQRFSFNTGGFINNADVYDQSSFIYTDGLVTNNGRRNGTVIYQAGTYKPNESIFEGDYHNTLFTYVYNPNLQNATVEDIPYNNGQMKAISYNDIYYDNDYLCIFGDYDQLDHVFMSCLKYNNYVGGWVTYKEVEPYSYFDIEDNQIRLYFNGNFIANTIIYLGFIPKYGSGFTPTYAYFYLTGKNTSTSGGIVVPSSYSGDNDVQQQINDNNLQEIKDTLTDDSQVDNMLGEFVSGDASDIAEKFGFSILNRYYYDFIHDTIVDIVEVLEDDGDVYFDYSMHGEAPTRIYASDFTTPDGTLKTFLSMFLISCTVFAFYKYIADLIELISTGNILDALQEFKVDRNIFKM